MTGLTNPLLINEQGEVMPRYVIDAAGRIVVRAEGARHNRIPYASHVLEGESAVFGQDSIRAHVEQWIEGIISNPIHSSSAVASIYHSGVPRVPYVFFPMSEAPIEEPLVQNAIATLDACNNQELCTQIRLELQKGGIYPIPLLPTFNPTYQEWDSANTEKERKPCHILKEGWASADMVFRRSVVV